MYILMSLSTFVAGAGLIKYSEGATLAAIISVRIIHQNDKDVIWFSIVHSLNSFENAIGGRIKQTNNFTSYTFRIHACKLQINNIVKEYEESYIQ